MTTIETIPTSTLNPEYTKGFELGYQRDRLSRILPNPEIDENGYCQGVVDYVNAFQDFHFDSGVSNFASYGDAARTLKMETELITGHAVQSLEDIMLRMQAYLTDEKAEELRQANSPVLARAMTLMLIDLIDEHRPNTGLNNRKKGV